ncbi:MAG TPA: hypothetical protein DEA73_08830 [Peptococcaceae bacterium]|nr:hypothetical protein [Peptococcaceae bacterium]
MIHGHRRFLLFFFILPEEGQAEQEVVIFRSDRTGDKELAGAVEKRLLGEFFRQVIQLLHGQSLYLALHF